MPQLSTLQKSLLIAGLTFLAYWPCLSGDFIIDDGMYLTNSRFIESPTGVLCFWFTNRPADYYPVSNTSLWIEWRLWGMDPTGYHVTNLLLHIASALLIWAILPQLRIPGAFLAAFLFAVHPVNVEAVAWISQRKDLLALFFFLLSIFWYLKADELFPHDGESLSAQPQTPDSRSAAEKWYRLSLLAFVLAMLSKGSPAMLPVILLGMVWWRHGKIARSDLSRSVPFFVVAVALVLMSIWMQSRVLEKSAHTGFAERLAGAGTAIWFYLSKALLPINLVFVYPKWTVQIGDILWWLPVVAAAWVTAILLWRFRGPRESWGRSLLFAWGNFCVALVPVLGFADVGYKLYSLVADHYQHIAIISVVAVVAATWSVWSKAAPAAIRPVATTVAMAAILMLALLTWQQSAALC